jgi:copper chaperone
MRCSSHPGTASPPEREEDWKVNETILKVADMSCGHCVATVENALQQVDGVNGVDVSLQTKLARVYHEGDIDTYALLAAVKATGFTPELDR